MPRQKVSRASDGAATPPRAKSDLTAAEMRKYVALADLCGEFVGMCDLEFRPLYVNPAGLRIVGLDSLEEARSVRVPDFLFPEDRPYLLSEFFSKVLREGKAEAEVRFRHFKTGAAIWMIYNVFLLKENDGKTIGFATFSQSITERKQAEQALRESEERLRRLSETLEAQVRSRTNELEQRNAEILEQSEQLRELWNRLLRTQDEERRHIARELHDSVGQHLAALSMVLGVARRDPSAVYRKLEEAAQITQTCVIEMRTLSHLLHPPLLEEAGLAAAVEWYVRGFAERSGIQTRVEIARTGRLGRELELVLFRVLQESLTNVHRHSRSKTVAIRIGADSKQVWLEVQDQGQGSANGFLQPGVGITGMRERVKSLNGELEITSNRSGTLVRVALPLAAMSKAGGNGD